MHLKAIESTAQQRIKMKKIKLYFQTLFYACEYIGYILTFYLLMGVRVLPDYPAVQTYNPIRWTTDLPVFNHYMLLLFLILLIRGFIHAQSYLSSDKRDRSLMEDLYIAFKATGYAFLMSIGVTFLLKTTFIYSRVALVAFVVLMLVEAVFWRGSYKLINAMLNRRGHIKERILIVGAGKVGSDLQWQLSRELGHKAEIVGFLDDYKIGDEILDKISGLEKVLQNRHVDVVYITIPSERSIIESILHTIYKYNVDIRIIPEMFDRMSTVFTFRTDAGKPYMQIVKTPLRGINVLLKRFFDLSISFCLLLLLSPLFLALGLWIKLDSKGAVFFKQTRVGKNGVPFQMIKFRSMRADAEAMKEALAKINEAEGPAFKLRQDPRVTRSGRFLRKYSLDELPQLWNVFAGRMSLIGPRPPLPDEVAQYTNYHWRRMDVLPGMTGLWQVSGRSDLNFDDWIDLDIHYIERWSLSLEMKILLKTIPVVVKGTGAY
ncbi:sugar transferase [Cohnella sp. 56]|uniref:sugar transferase n=1 Tax=Cohnella sp. 56 TaxID=3113722 RepID=UPI0030E778BE